VISCRDPEWGESVKALVVPKAGAAIEPDGIIRFCKERLANYKAPKSVEVVASLPRTGLGKIDRGKLERQRSELGER
jgi:fatty-acyl-CoA synthase